MANNIILTPNVFCKGVLMNLGGYLSFCRNMTKDYNKEFIGKHVGDTVSVRKPQIFTATTGLLFQPQPLTNIKTNITVGDVTGVHWDWDGVEKTLSIDEAQEKYFKPAAIAMAHRINANADRRRTPSPLRFSKLFSLSTSQALASASPDSLSKTSSAMMRPTTALPSADITARNRVNRAPPPARSLEEENAGST